MSRRMLPIPTMRSRAAAIWSFPENREARVDNSTKKATTSGLPCWRADANVRRTRLNASERSKKDRVRMSLPKAAHEQAS